MRPIKFIALIVVSMLLLSFGLGCSNSADDSDTSSGTQSNEEKAKEETNPASGFKGAIDEAREVASPMIKIVTPAPASVISGSSVSAQVGVENINLVNKLGQPNVAGEGHIHYIIDGGAPTPSANSLIDLPITPGKHTLKVELHNNDHSPLDPPIEANVEFTVE